MKRSILLSMTLAVSFIGLCLLLPGEGLIADEAVISDADEGTVLSAEGNDVPDTVIQQDPTACTTDPEALPAQAPDEWIDAAVPVPVVSQECPGPPDCDGPCNYCTLSIQCRFICGGPGFCNTDYGCCDCPDMGPD